MGKTALLVGATGLVGGFVLEQLLEDAYYDSVVVLSRKSLQLQHAKLKEVLVNFDQLENYTSDIKADVVFCCLGTTIKAAGSQEAFKKVDYEYPLRVAEIAKQNGAAAFLIVTALGAAKSSIIFYNRVKGEVEEAIGNLHYDAFHILQPSLIIGERKESRTREGIAQTLSPIYDTLMFGPLTKYKSIKAEQIAKAMIHYSKQETKGIMRHESGELQKI
ncbi:MAG TPA: NAD(P)H-binding protein [Chitinophagales bacterium]|nr:NAD(P)H-binding protein [Chitinophagales bacterium]